MKKNILFMLMAAVLGLSACSKCGNCTITVVQEAKPATTGYPIITTSTRHACGEEYEQLDGMVETSTASSGGTTVTITTTAKCIKD